MRQKKKKKTQQILYSTIEKNRATKQKIISQ